MPRRMQFLKITDDPANRPMFIHCTAAIRVGAFWAIRRARARWAHAGRGARRRPKGRAGQRAAPRRVRAQVHRVASTKKKLDEWRGGRAGLTLAGACSSCPVAARRATASSAAPAWARSSRSPASGIPVTEARCLRLTVPENQTTRRGRTISLRIVVLPATGTERAEDAVVYLAGGPGQAATELIADSSLAADGVARAARRRVMPTSAAPAARTRSRVSSTVRPISRRAYFDTFLPIQKVRACRSRLEQTADLAQYTTSASVEDLEAIRVALEIPAAHAPRRVLRHAPGDGVRAAVRAARPRRDPRKRR